MNRDLLQEIYFEYAQEIYLYIYSLCRNEAAAEDLMHDVFVQALMTLSDDHPNFRAWLYKVAHNLCRNMLRSREYRHSNLIHESAGDDNACDVLDDMLKTERKRQLYLCINRLPALQKEIIFMEYFTDMDCSEIASALDMSQSNVRVVAHRARKKLKLLLERAEKKGDDKHEL